MLVSTAEKLERTGYLYAAPRWLLPYYLTDCHAGKNMSQSDRCGQIEVGGQTWAESLMQAVVVYKLV